MFGKSNMKKLALILLILIAGLFLTACGGGGGGSSGDSRTTSGTTNRVTLSWAAPTTRSDGSFLPVTELQGYRVYYGTSAGSLSMLVDLNDDITEFTVDMLPTGNYYFAVTAYDSDGTESGFSNLINKDV